MGTNNVQGNSVTQFKDLNEVIIDLNEVIVIPEIWIRNTYRISPNHLRIIKKKNENQYRHTGLL